jgi:hypothetical protein
MDDQQIEQQYDDAIQQAHKIAEQFEITEADIQAEIRAVRSTITAHPELAGERSILSLSKDAGLP